MQKNYISFSALIISVIGLSACASKEASEPMKTKAQSESVMSTVKPGATIAFTSEAPKGLQIGETGRIKINITDGYYAGTMKLKAVPETGLRFVSETGLKEFSMIGAKSHQWELDVTASAKGVYYVNIFAEAVTSPNLKPQFRSHAVRVQIGDLTDAEMKNYLETSGALSSDGTVVVMQADEVIK